MQSTERVLSALRKEKTKEEEYILSGGVASFEEYRFHLGRLKAFEMSIEIYINILKGIT